MLLHILNNKVCHLVYLPNAQADLQSICRSIGDAFTQFTFFNRFIFYASIVVIGKQSLEIVYNNCFPSLIVLDCSIKSILFFVVLVEQLLDHYII